ncbi:MAG: SDR family oxidoreductase [Acetobacteraceae bacterium]|nr:SDR family oxidoreductase [Acetobacteraceae bacterium]
MRVFVTGATGWVGSALTRELIDAGHQVVGLVRSEDKARALAALGGEPLMGSLSDIDVLKAGARAADGVIHTAFGVGLGQPAVFAASAKEDRQAIEAFGEVFQGSDRPILVTGGIGVLPRGQWFTEETPPPPPPPEFPRESEQTALALANRGLHANTVRLPRAVHGAGETHGFIPRLMALARQKGVSGYIGDGQNLWPSVHRLDAARVYRLALERGAEVGPFHAVGEDGIAFLQIAAAIGRRLDLPLKSISPDGAAEHFGPMAIPVGGNGPVSTDRTRALLGWQPREPGLIEDISHPENYK